MSDFESHPDVQALRVVAEDLVKYADRVLSNEGRPGADEIAQKMKTASARVSAVLDRGSQLYVQGSKAEDVAKPADVAPESPVPDSAQPQE